MQGLPQPVAELVELAALKPHPRNYRAHPFDQVEHLSASMRENGVYRNVVIARDGTILAGHGVVEAARKVGLDAIPAVRLDMPPDDPRALKVLAGDNEVTRLAEVDDRALTEMLKEISNRAPGGLLGTGFDEKMLANLVFVTRPEDEIKSIDAAAEWTGMPDYKPVVKPLHIIVSFDTVENRNDFARKLGVEITDATKSLWWPPKAKDDPASLEFRA